jgi:RNA polymerase sigma-70 factor (ECF subfamily)
MVAHLLAMEGPNRVIAPVAGDAVEDRRDIFGRLATAEMSASYRLAVRLLGDRGEAEDAVHEAILRAWNGFDGLRDREKFRPWLARIVVNTCRNVLERRRSNG